MLYIHTYTHIHTLYTYLYTYRYMCGYDDDAMVWHAGTLFSTFHPTTHCEFNRNFVKSFIPIISYPISVCAARAFYIILYFIDNSHINIVYNTQRRRNSWWGTLKETARAPPPPVRNNVNMNNFASGHIYKFIIIFQIVKQHIYKVVILLVKIV